MPERPRRPKSDSGWLLPPLLALLAIVVQFALDVPTADMLVKEDGGTKPSSAAKGKAKAKSKSKSKSKSKPRGYQARPDKHVAILRETWSERPIDTEPVEQGFRRRHEALLRSIVTRLRAEALHGHKATPMQIRPTCHTVRCALELCGDAEVITDIAGLLPEVSVGGLELWHELREAEPTREPPKRKTTTPHVCRRWIVGFAIEGPELRELDIPELPDATP